MPIASLRSDGVLFLGRAGLEALDKRVDRSYRKVH